MDGDQLVIDESQAEIPVEQDDRVGLAIACVEIIVQQDRVDVRGIGESDHFAGSVQIIGGYQEVWWRALAKKIPGNGNGLVVAKLRVAVIFRNHDISWHNLGNSLRLARSRRFACSRRRRRDAGPKR